MRSKNTSKIYKERTQDLKEIFDYKETPIVSLPQFVIDRVKPCVDSFEDGLTMDGALMVINGLNANGTKMEDDSEFQLPIDLPKLTPEFEQWRDDFYFHSIRQMKLMLALIYNYRLEEPND